MKQRFWLFKRGSTFYCQDSDTGEQKSLSTKDRVEALRLIDMKRQSAETPGFSRFLLKACLATQDAHLVTRTWQMVMEQMSAHGKESTKARCKRAMLAKGFNRIRNKKLIETTSDDFLAILVSPSVSIHHYLKRLHNLALGLGWLAFPVLAPRMWPAVTVKEKRAITLAEHQMILTAEKNPERKLFYQLLWEIGAAQSDAAELNATNIDWETKTLSFRRKKTGSWSYLSIGKTLASILEQLPKSGALFPSISLTSANDRAAEFYRRCKLLKIRGVSLHSYRYSMAERAKAVGMPERFAMEMLGHNSRAVHRAYSKGARVKLPSLEEFMTFEPLPN